VPRPIATSLLRLLPAWRRSTSWYRCCCDAGCPCCRRPRYCGGSPTGRFPHVGYHGCDMCAEGSDNISSCALPVRWDVEPASSQVRVQVAVSPHVRCQSPRRHRSERSENRRRELDSPHGEQKRLALCARDPRAYPGGTLRYTMGRARAVCPVPFRRRVCHGKTPEPLSCGARSRAGVSHPLARGCS
jgi:hypothetical protein